jgi:hypothetical protein
MRAHEILSEGLLDFLKRKLGVAWGKAGDVVKGSVVAEFLSINTYHSDSTLSQVKDSKFQLNNIDLATAKKYRLFTDQNASHDVIDSNKMDAARARKITYDSLVKNPPVVDRDGFIWDGNHRMQRAIELELAKIPVLIQISGSRF